MSSRIFAALIGALAIVLVATGCGGGGDSTEVTAASISKAQFIKQAEAICESGNKQLQIDFAAFLKNNAGIEHPTEATYAELVNTVVAPDIEREVEELRELGAPSADLDQVQAMLDAREESVALAEEDPQAVTHNSEKVFAKASKLAKEYGMETCATR
jgi:hypothetical protein